MVAGLRRSFPPGRATTRFIVIFWCPGDTKYRKTIRKPRSLPVPVERFVTLSSSQLPYLDAAGKMDLLVGLGGTEHISTMSARRLVAAGKIHEVGIFTNVRMEALLDLSPDIVMASASGSAYDPHPKLLEAGMPVVLTLAHIEKSPLGRCEWIKFLAMFIGTEEHAEALFEEIAGRYEALVRKTGRHLAPARGYYRRTDPGEMGTPGAANICPD